MHGNLEVIENLLDNFTGLGYDFIKMPYVLQLNKRHLPTALEPEKQIRRGVHRSSLELEDAIARYIQAQFVSELMTQNNSIALHLFTI